jgi:flavin-dependent dehydrogenase
MRALTETRDVFVVGGGPAGLAVGIACAQRGLRVTVADLARPPIDKVCGEGIMPDGVLALRSLGLDLTGLASTPFEGIRFVDASGEVSARFPQGVGLGMRRSALHSALTAKAESLGVHLAWGMRVESVQQFANESMSKVVAAGKTFESRYVVCADGQNSALREVVGLGAGKVYRRRFGFRSHYRLRPISPSVEVHWADCGQVYVTPLGAEDICVVLITGDSHLRLEQALAAFPELQERLEGVMPSDRTAGGVTVTRKLNAVTNGRVALLGDSSGSADAITGDGLSLAFQQAVVLAYAMQCGDLGEYRRMHRQISRVPRTMGELMLMMDDYPWLRRRVFRGFARSPEMFGKLLAMHTRTISPLQLGVKDCLAFGWNFLWN